MNLLFDIGATKTRLALSEGDKVLEEKRTFLTPPDYGKLLKEIQTAAKELLQGRTAEIAIGGIAGRLNANKSVLVKARKLHLWEGQPLKQDLERFLGCNILLENDAALGALGEAVFGAGANSDIVAFLTVSTGFGGARVVNKKIDANALGFEPGKQIIYSGAESSTLEDLISGNALLERFGQSAEDITDRNVWTEFEQLLAIGINNAFVFWSPGIVVLGGGVLNSSHIDLERVRVHFKEITRLSVLPEIQKSALGDLCGIYGALAYSRQI